MHFLGKNSFLTRSNLTFREKAKNKTSEGQFFHENLTFQGPPVSTNDLAAVSLLSGCLLGRPWRRGAVLIIGSFSLWVRGAGGADMIDLKMGSK